MISMISSFTTLETMHVQDVVRQEFHGEASQEGTYPYGTLGLRHLLYAFKRACHYRYPYKWDVCFRWL
jgi:hypothetical protein